MVIITVGITVIEASRGKHENDRKKASRSSMKIIVILSLNLHGVCVIVFRNFFEVERNFFFASSHERKMSLRKRLKNGKKEILRLVLMNSHIYAEWTHFGFFLSYSFRHHFNVVHNSRIFSVMSQIKRLSAECCNFVCL